MLGAGDACAGEQAMNGIGAERITTHCLGRFQVDLPADAEYIGGSYDYAFAMYFLILSDSFGSYVGCSCTSVSWPQAQCGENLLP